MFTSAVHGIVNIEGRWLTWNGRRWEVDETQSALDLARSIGWETTARDFRAINEVTLGEAPTLECDVEQGPTGALRRRRPPAVLSTSAGARTNESPPSQ